jgi:hypothetical protein
MSLSDPHAAEAAPRAPGLASREELIAANINPDTGLATDYLNHFNEAVMLLEMIPDMPDCADDFMAWQPLSYVEHFNASHFGGRELAIKAYQAAEPQLRGELDDITGAITGMLLSTREAIRASQRPASSADLARRGAGLVRPLLTLAGSLINGHGATAGSDAEIDDILAREA